MTATAITPPADAWQVLKQELLATMPPERLIDDPLRTLTYVPTLASTG